MPGRLRDPGIPDPTATTGGELAKSGATRRRILDAAVQVLASQGYRRFSTSAVAGAAGLTRPAMLYHFRSRRDLTTATARHLARRRIEMFEAAMNGIADKPGELGRGVRAAAVDAAWDQLDTREFAAFTELTMAARTDAELAMVLHPMLIAFDRARHDVTERTLPPGSWNAGDIRLSRDVVRFLLEGLVQQMWGIEDREERVAAIRHFLRMLVASAEGHEFLAAVIAGRPDEPLPPAGG